MNRTVFRAASAAVLALAAASPAIADVLQLADGRFVDGVKMRVEGQSVVLQYQNGDVKVPFALVEDFVIEGLPPWEPKTDEERAKRAQGLVPFKGKWVKPEVREKGVKDDIAKRKADIEEQKAHQEWRNRYRWETKNFLFESTLSPRLGEKYADLLETYFEDAKKVWGIKVPKDWGKLKVCLYRDRKTFEQTSGGRGGTLAYYRFVAPRELNCYYDRANPELAIQCALHEATHYVVDLIDEDSQYPHWINEAMAEYLGSSEVDVKAKTVKPGGIVGFRLAEVRADIERGRHYGLAELMGGGGAYEDYSWGWSFVHFMMQTPAHAKRFRQYFFDLAKAKDVNRLRGAFNLETVSGDESLRVFMKRFGIDSLDAIQSEWYAHIEKMATPGVLGLEQAGIDAFWKGMWKFRAPRLLKAAIDGGSTKPQVFVLYSRSLRIAAGRERDPSKADAVRDEAMAVLEKGIEKCDPLDSDLRAEIGFAMYERGRKDDAKKMIELAREMNPEEPYLDIEILEAFAQSGGGE